MLRHIPAVEDPRVLVDAATRDDAAVYQLTADRAIVATVDFFTPIVDDAYTFGAIAAANAFSDIYAMGARPLLALNLVAWPRDPDVLALLGDTLRGGADVARRAGAAIVGGHSIDDPEPKYGLVAIGECRPDEILTNAGARAGDRIVLTKALGTGVLSTALKRDVLTEDEMADAIASMTQLNADAADAVREIPGAVHACTDVTGFGLLGHLAAMLRASGVGARLVADDVPLLPGARDAVAAGAVPGGTQRNLAAADPHTEWAPHLSPEVKTLLVDAQTSGGLLLSIHPDRTDAVVAALGARRTHGALIGEITAGPAGHVEVA